MKKMLLTGLALACLARPAIAADANEAMAAVMAVVTFNVQHCPTARPNEEMVAKSFNTLGVNSANMMREPYKSSILDMMSSFAAQPAYFCEATWTLYGPEGTQLKNLLVRR